MEEYYVQNQGRCADGKNTCSKFCSTNDSGIQTYLSDSTSAVIASAWSNGQKPSLGTKLAQRVLVKGSGRLLVHGARMCCTLTSLKEPDADKYRNKDPNTVVYNDIDIFEAEEKEEKSDAAGGNDGIELQAGIKPLPAGPAQSGYSGSSEAKPNAPNSKVREYGIRSEIHTEHFENSEEKSGTSDYYANDGYGPHELVYQPINSAEVQHNIARVDIHDDVSTDESDDDDDEALNAGNRIGTNISQGPGLYRGTFAVRQETPHHRDTGVSKTIRPRAFGGRTDTMNQDPRGMAKQQSDSAPQTPKLPHDLSVNKNDEESSISTLFTDSHQHGLHSHGTGAPNAARGFRPNMQDSDPKSKQAVRSTNKGKRKTGFL